VSATPRPACVSAVSLHTYRVTEQEMILLEKK